MNDPVSVKMLISEDSLVQSKELDRRTGGFEILQGLISEKISQRFALNDFSLVRFLNSFGSRFMG